MKRMIEVTKRQKGKEREREGREIWLRVTDRAATFADSWARVSPLPRIDNGARKAICRTVRLPPWQSRISAIRCIIHGLLNYLLPLVDELHSLVDIGDRPTDSGDLGPARKLPHQLETSRRREDRRVRHRRDLVIDPVLKAKTDRLIVVTIPRKKPVAGQKQRWWKWSRSRETLSQLDCSTLIALHRANDTW